MNPNPTAIKYNGFSRILHWLVALSIIIMLCIGISFDYVGHAALGGNLMFIHKSLGATLLLLMLVRIGWRLFHQPPPLPDTFKPWEKRAANINHYLLYIFATVMPLTGLFMSSFSNKMIPFWGLFLFRLPVAINQHYAHVFSDLHEACAWVLFILIAIHLGAIIKHHAIDKYNLIQRML